MKPVSISTARAIAPLLPARISDCIIAPASMNWRKLCTSGKPLRLTRGADAAGLDREQQRREDDDRRHQLGAAEGLLDRAPAQGPHHPDVHARPTRLSTAAAGLLVLLEVVAGFGRRRRRRGWGGRAPASRPRCRRRRAPRTTRGMSAAPFSTSTSTVLPSVGGSRLADPGADPLGLGDRPLLQGQADVGVADRRLERLGRALGDHPPPVDDADVVGELVGLLQVLGGEKHRRPLVVQRAHLLPDRFAADRVEARGRLVEEEDSGLVDEGGGEVEAPLHAAGVLADAAVRRLGEVDALQQVVGPAPAFGGRASPAASPAA